MNQTQNCSWTQNAYPRSSQRVCMDHQKGAFQEQKHLTGGDGARAPPHPRALCGSLLSCGSRILCVSANWARSILAPRWDGSGHAWTDDSENHEPGEKKGARMCVCVLLAFILFSQPPLSSSHGAATDGENVMFQPKKTRFASHFDGVMSLPWANWAVAVKAGRNERRKHRTTQKEGGSCQLNPPSHKACSEWRGCGCSAWTHADLRRKHPPTHARSVGRSVELRGPTATGRRLGLCSFPFASSPRPNLQPRPPVSPRVRAHAPHTRLAPQLLTASVSLTFLTGSECFHGRGLSLRLCPGLAAPYRRWNWGRYCEA